MIDPAASEVIMFSCLCTMVEMKYQKMTILESPALFSWIKEEKSALDDFEGSQFNNMKRKSFVI